MDGVVTSAVARPLKAHNALEAALFSIEFQEPPSQQAVEAIRLALRSFSQELPGEQQAQANGVFFAMGAAFPPPGDVVRFMAKPNGDHSWRIQLIGNVFQVGCFDYSRFEEVWPRAQRYLLAVLSALDASSLVSAVSHQYVDKFLYPTGMTVEQYVPQELFREDTPFLTRQSFNAGPLWHVFQGWFRSVNQQQRVLHQINITNSDFGQANVTCVIDHRCSHQFAPTAQSNAVAMAASEQQATDSLNMVMRQLHASHKEMLRQLLQPAKLQQIGMGE